MTKAKKDTPAPAGHNEQPAPDAVKALNIAKLMAADILLDEAKADHKWVKKHVEAKGINLKAAAWADKIIKSGKALEAITLFRDTLEILMIRGRPVPAPQLDLLADNHLAPADENAAKQGRYAGIMGMSMDANPYGPVGTQGQAWIEAFYGGEKERELILALEPGPDSELIKGDNDDPFEDEFEAADPKLAAAE